MALVAAGACSGDAASRTGATRSVSARTHAGAHAAAAAADAELPAAEKERARGSEQLASQGAGRGATPGAADVALVRAWFAGKRAGKPELPDRLFVDGQPVTAERFLKTIDQGDLFALEKRTPLRHVADSLAGDALAGEKTRTISVDTGAPSPTCHGDDEECEGHEWLEMTFDDRGRLRALNAAAAACPFVYAAGSIQPLALEGEVLRNVNRPSRETTQALRLHSIARCETTIRVRIAEEKAETSFLDAVHIEIDGVAVLPTNCRDEPGAEAPAYCRDDGVRHVIAQGDALDLVFAPPPGTGCGRVVLRANGYCLPSAR
jgi:hypothetical protein